MLTPDRDSQLSDGVVIETRLRARLFGAPVLRIDGTVLVSPARIDPPTSPRVVRAEVVPGTALAQAARLLEECKERLGHRGR